MTTGVEALALLKGAFETEWGDTTPIAWRNVAFDPEKVEDKDAGWVRCGLIFAGSDPDIEIGTTNTRRNALVMIECFAPEGSGEERLATLSDKAERWLAKWPLNDLTVLTPEVIDVGPDGEGWTQHNVNAPCYFDSNG